MRKGRSFTFFVFLIITMIHNTGEKFRGIQERLKYQNDKTLDIMHELELNEYDENELLEFAKMLVDIRRDWRKRLTNILLCRKYRWCLDLS